MHVGVTEIGIPVDIEIVTDNISRIVPVFEGPSLVSKKQGGGKNYQGPKQK